MAKFEFKKYDREKIKPKVKSKRLFITASSSDGKDQILTSSFNEMSNSFANNSYLDPYGKNTTGVGGLIYMINEMQGDIEDLHSEISQSVYVSQVSEFSSIATASIGNISSSFIPDKEDKYYLGSSSREWHTSYMLTASIGGGIFTSASLASGGGGNADFSSVGEHIIPAADDTYHLGASNKQFKNLYLDGTAYIDVLSADTLAKPVAPAILTAQSFKSTLVDVSLINVLQVNISKSVKVEGFASEIPGHEITIINIGSGAVQLVRSTKGAKRTIYGSSNITINQHETCKLVMSSAQVWYVL
tara:strand:- start:272 stop:1177 length:906 start_codon:yes stop_codon:yes gene_type:complete